MNNIWIMIGNLRNLNFYSIYTPILIIKKISHLHLRLDFSPNNPVLFFTFVYVFFIFKVFSQPKKKKTELYIR